MTQPDPVGAVYQQFWGAPSGPSGPPDTITVYDGTDASKGQTFSFRAWDLRGPLLRLVWDLLRFRKLSDGASIAAEIEADPAKPHGLYDWLMYVAYKLSQQGK
jgi:hypothetical protein